MSNQNQHLGHTDFLFQGQEERGLISIGALKVGETRRGAWKRIVRILYPGELFAPHVGALGGEAMQTPAPAPAPDSAAPSDHWFGGGVLKRG